MLEEKKEFARKKEIISKKKGKHMENIIREQLSRRIERLFKVIEKAEERLKVLPDGRINIRKRGELVYYYIFRKGHKEQMIKQSEKGLLEDFLQTGYLKAVIIAAKSELEILKKTQRLYPLITVEEVFENLPPERREGVKPIILSDEQFRQMWENSTYPLKPIKEGVPFYTTLRGERVRSKSEAIIADRLYACGIPYKYECPVNVGGVIFHPDFTILRMSDRKILYLEHCGKTGDKEYAEDMVKRANDYALAGINQGDRLFFTFETADTPLNTDVLDEMIENCFR